MSIHYSWSYIFPSHMDSGLVHMTCFGLWDNRKYDTRPWMDLHIGLRFLPSARNSVMASMEISLLETWPSQPYHYQLKQHQSTAYTNWHKWIMLCKTIQPQQMQKLTTASGGSPDKIRRTRIAESSPSCWSTELWASKSLL